MRYETIEDILNADNVIRDLIFFLDRERNSTKKSDSVYLTSILSRQNITRIGKLFDENQVLNLGHLNAIVLADHKLLVWGSTYDAENTYFDFVLYSNADKFYLSKKNDVIKLIDGKNVTLFSTNNSEEVRAPRLFDLTNIKNLMVPVTCLLDVVSYNQLFENAVSVAYENLTGKGQR